MTASTTSPQSGTPPGTVTPPFPLHHYSWRRNISNLTLLWCTVRPSPLNGISRAEELVGSVWPPGNIWRVLHSKKMQKVSFSACFRLKPKFQLPQILVFLEITLPDQVLRSFSACLPSSQQTQLSQRGAAQQGGPSGFLSR